MSRPIGSSFFAHAPGASARVARVYPDDPQRGIDEAERALATVPFHREQDVAAWLVADPLHGIATLAALADRPHSLVGERLAGIVPELGGLAANRDRTTFEHQRPEAADSSPTPLLDGVIRALCVAKHETEILDAATRSLVTAVLLFADVAKGGTPDQRATWLSRLGVDGAVHNEDSAEIFDDVARRILHKIPMSDDGRWTARVKILCATTGLCGMRLRGEVGRDVFVAFRAFAAREPDGGRSLLSAWSIINHASTAAVRDGLWTPALAAAFRAEEKAIARAAPSELLPSPLAERLARIRLGALAEPAAIAEMDNALSELRGARPPLESRLARCRIWYAEAALGGLTQRGMLRLLTHLAGRAVAAGRIDINRAWHLDLLGVVPELRGPDGEVLVYPTRLLETMLAETSLADLTAGRLGHDPGRAALLSFPAAKGGEEALVVELEASAEARALMTLLPIYEKKETATFHRTLKALCDVYGLRKDGFDRVANEASYLATMNSARIDKARLLDLVVPGLVVEVGPGGGAILELCAERFKGTRVVGLDASAAVIEAHRTRHPSGGPFEMIHGDALEIGTHFAEGRVTTIIFSSVLHEVFSYTCWPPGGGGSRFELGSVDAVVQAAFRALAPGGRIIVRDGVQPRDEAVVLELRDPTWRAGLDQFAECFEPRAIAFETLPARPTQDGLRPRVRLRAPDAYEFLTTYTWGPASFPYEVREQRALLGHREYAARLLEVCRATGAEAHEIPLPPELASYSTDGYREHLSPRIALFDSSGEEEIPLFDITGVWAIEKR